MGVDLLLVGISITPRQTSFGSLSNAEVNSEFRRKIGNLEKEIDEDNSLNGWGDFAERRGMGEPESNDIQAVENAAKEVINDFLYYLDSREVNTLIFPERAVLLTGGLSHGDDPTEAFNTFCMLEDFPVRILERAGIEVV